MHQPRHQHRYQRLDSTVPGKRSICLAPILGYKSRERALRQIHHQQQFASSNNTASRFSVLGSSLFHFSFLSLFSSLSPSSSTATATHSLPLTVLGHLPLFLCHTRTHLLSLYSPTHLLTRPSCSSAQPLSHLLPWPSWPLWRTVTLGPTVSTGASTTPASQVCIP